ncbi:hypothetical protein C9415_10180 [Kluyvera sp. Nf5]|nr:hypothetical protein C9415_10180 [Kluyvera sp. Nf5]
MSVKDLVENIKHNGLLVSASLLEKLYTIAIENEQKLVAVTEQRDALVEENVVMKGFGEKLNDMRNNLNGEGTGIQGRAEVACQQVALESAMEEFDAIKTPATDAAIAALRAEGVEMLAERRKKAADIARQRDDLCIADSLGVEAIRAQMFANELRESKGAQK